MIDPVTAVSALLAKNPVIAGGGVLMGMGGLMAYLRNIPNKLIGAVSYFFHFSVSIDNKSDAYPYIKEWIMGQTFSEKARHLSVDTIYLDSHNARINGDRAKVRLAITPAVGWNFAWIGGHPIIIRFSRTTQEKKDSGPTEAVVMRAFTRKGLEAARQVFDGIGDRIEGNLVDKVKIFGSRAGWSFAWSLKGAVDKRSMDTIVTDNNFLLEIAEDIRRFEKSKDWYSSKGIPWRRGFLLYGPAGGGKTSMVRALASELGRDIYCLNPKHAGDADILSDVPGDGILLIEEVDTLFTKRKEGKKSQKKNAKREAAITEAFDDDDDDGEDGDVMTRENNKEFNAFINALDGIMASEGRVLVMTTNHFDALDPALIRPGRADRQYYVGNATKYQLHHMFLKFFPGADNAAEAFSDMVMPDVVSVARLQEFLMTYRDSADLALANANELNPTKEITNAAVPV